METYAEDVENCAKQEHQTIHLEISEFSKTDSETTAPVLHHATGDAEGFSLRLFHNGRNQETEGCVSMQLFDILKGSGRNVGVCLVSIKDASNNFRLPRSFPFDNKGKSPMNPLVSMDYISRSQLLENSEEFLPNDALTLEIDIYFEKEFEYNLADIISYSSISLLTTLAENYRYEKDKDAFSDLIEEDLSLDLESKLGKRLCEESEFFKRIVENPLIEKANKRMKLTQTEHSIFYGHIAEMLFALKSISFDSINSIIDTYIVAEKYAITSISETCLLFLRLCQSDFDKGVLKEFIDDCEHMECRKLVECLREKLEGSESVMFSESRDCIEWKYDNRHGDLVFFRAVEKELSNEGVLKQIADEGERLVTAINMFLSVVENSGDSETHKSSEIHDQTEMRFDDFRSFITDGIRSIVETEKEDEEE